MEYAKYHETLHIDNDPVLIPSLIEFIGDFRSTAQIAERQVCLQTMYALPSHPTNILFHTLEEAAKRGVHASLYLDGVQSLQDDRKKINYMMHPYDSDAFHMHDEIVRSYKNLDTAGVDVRIVEPLPRYRYPVFPVGRNHIKMALVDDNAYLGGMNAGQESDYQRVDYMLKLHDEEIVNVLANQFANAGNESKQSDILTSTNSGDVLIDTGHPGRSLILDTAAEMISHTKTHDCVSVLTPWIPDGKLLHTLDQAYKRGVNVEVITSYQPFSLSMEGVYALAKKVSWLTLLKNGIKIPITFLPVEVHGKGLITQSRAGTNTLLTSHNFTNKGVLLGTKEIAFLTKDQSIGEQFSAFLQGIKNGIYY